MPHDDRNPSRREFLRTAAAATALGSTACFPPHLVEKQPNILVCISDDQSYPHASAYGCKFVDTPNFDRIAREGVLYTNAFCSSPGCSPSRASLLTGLHPWQLRQAGTHASSFPAELETYTGNHNSVRGSLESHLVGYTGKGWGPGRSEYPDDFSPAGVEFNQIEADTELPGIRRTDYAANFKAFLDQPSRPTTRPFCFWYGASEPHRPFGQGAGLRAGKRLEDVEVPSFLPDTREVRSDLLDYSAEIEHFDAHLGRMIELLEERDLLEDTSIIVTSDNGMAFPRAKANCYEDGAHVPLAIRGPRGFTGGRVVETPVSFVDLTATIYDVAETQFLRSDLRGHSLANAKSRYGGPVYSGPRDAVYFGRERHSSSRFNNLGYPQRAIRTKDYLYIRNFKPDRWPAGDPQKFEEDGTLGPMHGGYHDIDACPTLDYLIEHRDDPEVRPYFLMAVDKRPAEELFDIHKDPGCLTNLAGDPQHEQTRQELAEKLEAYLRETGDARVLGNGDIWETYERYSPIRTFPEPPASL